jgi:hypothetical protein
VCRYFSCIITRDLKVHWSKRTANHEELISELQLADTKLTDRDFVRIEITPQDEDKVTRNRADWQFYIDEEDTLPKWFTSNKAKAEEACWLSWEESVKVNLVLEGESCEVTNMLIQAYSAKHVVARDSSHVVAWGSSHVEAWDSSHVEARGSSHVEIKSQYVTVLKSDGTIIILNEAKVVKTKTGIVEV